MRNTNITKEFVEFNVLSSPVGLHMDNFSIKKTLNMTLELHEHTEHIIFALKKIQPRKATITINKTDIICVSTNRSFCRTPYIGVDYFKWCRNYTTRKKKKVIDDFCLVDKHHKLHYCANWMKEVDDDVKYVGLSV
jgi:hypothetical protein